MERIIRILPLILSGTCIFYFCSGDILTNTVGNTAIVPRIVWKKGTVTTTPDIVDSVKVTISYDTISIAKTFPFSADTGTFDSLPTGALINVLIEGLDSSSIVVYRGIKDSILLVGDWVEVVIEAHEVTPLAPDSLTATVISHDTIQLTWQDRSSNETNFYLERRIGTDSLDSLSVIGENLVSFTNTGLSPLTTYSYRIYAQNSAGYSLQYSESQPVTTPDTVTDIKPLFLQPPAAITGRRYEPRSQVERDNQNGYRQIQSVSRKIKK